MRKKEKENIIFKTRISRKTYFPFYLMIVALAVLLVFLYFEGYGISLLLIFIFILFTFAVINITETHRFSSSYAIQKDSLTCIYGLLNKNIVKLDYYGISNIDINQNLWQWILGFGDIEVKLFSRENKSVLKNINKPSKFVERLEKVMESKRK